VPLQRRPSAVDVDAAINVMTSAASMGGCGENDSPRSVSGFAISTLYGLQWIPTQFTPPVACPDQRMSWLITASDLEYGQLPKPPVFEHRLTPKLNGTNWHSPATVMVIDEK